MQKLNKLKRFSDYGIMSKEKDYIFKYMRFSKCYLSRYCHKSYYYLLPYAIAYIVNKFKLKCEL